MVKKVGLILPLYLMLAYCQCNNGFVIMNLCQYPWH
mgnify:CR=1 FL=1